MESTPLPTGTVTFLFTDIEGSTQLWDRHPEAMREALARHDACLRRAIETHGGAVFKTMGDAFYAAFPTAPAALSTALEAQRAFLAQPWEEVGPVRVRMALNTGTVELREGDYFGPALNRVARLLEAGHGGQVLLSQATADLVREVLPEGVGLRDLGAHRLKGLQQPEHLFQLLHPGLPADFPPIRSLDLSPNNLPRPLTSFVAREREMTEIREQLANTALLTLTGAGGCGKTRLALEIAAERIAHYPDGVWLVELAALTDPSLVPQTVAAALGVREEPGRPLAETLVDHLHPRSLLLVLDNCEHLLSPCAHLAESLLRRCRKLQLLATSRESLGIAGEVTYRVPSLSWPDLHRLTQREIDLVHAVNQCEAVRLFVERAVASQPGFSVTPRNVAALAQICQRLDGIPLAIELAAARVKAMPIEQIAARLGDRFRLLTGGSRTALPRQQTLRATMDWSYNLLSGTERALLRRLSAFAGGCTLEAAEVVCPADEVAPVDVLDLLVQLVEKSLVLYEERNNEGRYRLLETVRQYSRDRLLEAEEAAAVRERHRDWFVSLAERAEPGLFGEEQAVWLNCLEAEHDNLRAALDWSIESDEPDAGLRLAGSIWRFWHVRGYREEGRERLARLLTHPAASQRSLWRAKALDGAGVLSLGSGKLDEAHSRYEEMLAIGRELSDSQVIATALNGLGDVTRYQGDFARARSLFEEGLATSREIGDRWNSAFALHCLGFLHKDAGRCTEARTVLSESLAIRRELGDQRSIAYSLLGLGDTLLLQGEIAAARGPFDESLTIWRELGDCWGMTTSLQWLGGFARVQGEYDTARTLLQECLSIAHEMRDPMSITWALQELAVLERDQGEDRVASDRFQESLAIAQKLGASWEITVALNGLGEIARRQGDAGGARAHLEESVSIQRGLGPQQNKAILGDSLRVLALVALQEGEAARAGSLCRESLALYREARHWVGIAAALETTAGTAAASGDLGQVSDDAAALRRAVRLLGAAASARERFGAPVPLADRLDHERIATALRAALDEEAFAVAWAAGREITLEQAVAVALGENHG